MTPDVIPPVHRAATFRIRGRGDKSDSVPSASPPTGCGGPGHALKILEGAMTRKHVVLYAAAALVAGCAAEQPTPTGFEFRAPLFAAGGDVHFNLGIHLRGGGEGFTPATPYSPD